MSTDPIIAHAELMAGVFLERRDAGLIVSTLCAMPARCARAVIKLLNGIDAASAAGMWRPGLAPIELNRLVADFHADMLAWYLMERINADMPAWATERLTSRDIAHLFAEPWEQPFTTLETYADVIARTQTHEAD